MMQLGENTSNAYLVRRKSPIPS